MLEQDFVVPVQHFRDLAGQVLPLIKPVRPSLRGGVLLVWMHGQIELEKHLLGDLLAGLRQSRAACIGRDQVFQQVAQPAFVGRLQLLEVVLYFLSQGSARRRHPLLLLLHPLELQIGQEVTDLTEPRLLEHRSSRQGALGNHNVFAIHEVGVHRQRQAQRLVKATCLLLAHPQTDPVEVAEVIQADAHHLHIHSALKAARQALTASRHMDCANEGIERVHDNIAIKTILGESIVRLLQSIAEGEQHLHAVVQKPGLF
mmetsp:Transcript_125754/g.363806  ORF Transcript_125754/g.363806 Transcript_125754/m.363806 type:complete len:258 (-) Transcript_125754:336-1109(-)